MVFWGLSRSSNVVKNLKLKVLFANICVYTCSNRLSRKELRNNGKREPILIAFIDGDRIKSLTEPDLAN